MAQDYCKNCKWVPCNCRKGNPTNFAVGVAIRRFQKDQIVADLRKGSK